jgi:hypothetical protein
MKTAFKQQMCLMQHERLLSTSCLQVIANQYDAIVPMCHQDILSHCSTVEPGEGRVHDCLLFHKDVLSIKCARQLDASESKYAPPDLQNELSRLSSIMDFVFSGDGHIIENYNDDDDDDDDDDDSSESWSPNQQAPAHSLMDLSSILARSENELHSRQTAALPQAPVMEDGRPADSRSTFVMAALATVGVAGLIVLVSVSSRIVRNTRARRAGDTWNRQFAPLLS